MDLEVQKKKVGFRGAVRCVVLDKDTGEVIYSPGTATNKNRDLCEGFIQGLNLGLAPEQIREQAFQEAEDIFHLLPEEAPEAIASNLHKAGFEVEMSSLDSSQLLGDLHLLLLTRDSQNLSEELYNFMIDHLKIANRSWYNLEATRETFEVNFERQLNYIFHLFAHKGCRLVFTDGKDDATLCYEMNKMVLEREQL